MSIREKLYQELHEHYIALGDRGNTRVAALIEDLEAFLEALPEGKEVSPAVSKIIVSSIHQSIHTTGSLQYPLQISLLTLINTCP